MAKKLSFVLALAVCLAVVLIPGVALANFAIHGGYVADTDACAGCHRAHTSVSSITWTNDSGAERSALLVSDATTILDFCYACHDSASQGAETNVEEGLYRGTNYGVSGGDLNGGGFSTFKGASVTSYHMIEWDGTNGAWGAWGGGPYSVPTTSGTLSDAQMSVEASGNLNTDGGTLQTTYTFGAGNMIPMDCTSCHDPHGSSNYRILKDQVNGVAVGGYEGGVDAGNDPNPTPFVISAEVGYPTTGFRLHNKYPGYTPNYTTPQYAKGPGGDATKGMSGWCAGCHTSYVSEASTYNAGDEYGLAYRHRHPINQELSDFEGVRSLVADSGLPLAHEPAEAGSLVNSESDWIECLTCHVAHGTSAEMTGYAAGDDRNPMGSGQFLSGTASSLLRMDNRGVCEACHNK